MFLLKMCQPMQEKEKKNGFAFFVLRSAILNSAFRPLFLHCLPWDPFAATKPATYNKRRVQRVLCLCEKAVYVNSD